MTNLNTLLQKFDREYLLRIDNKQWKKKVPYRLQKGLEEINPNAFFVQENKLLILFFDFTEKQRNKKELFEKIWNLGGAPVVYVIDDDIEIYNGFSFDSKNSVWFERLKIGGKKAIDEDISFWDILSGKLWEQLPESKNQVDEKLLKNIEDAQKALRKNGLNFLSANNIIGRLLFTRYLIDREVKIKYFKNEEAFLKVLEIKNKELLYKFFEYLKRTFNGSLFPVLDGEKEQINDKHLEILFNLFNGTEIESGQQSLFKIYNFKIIPIELISEVYERFMGKEKQREEGAYYTPSFLVDYILEKTVKKHLEKNNSCRVFDPSCGSGIFLVETLRCIIEKNLGKNGKISEKKLKEIVKDNIFGVDKNEIAINLSVFSICLTLLDYIKPKDITNFRFEKLKDRNLFAKDFFDTKYPFNEKIKDMDFILGNPPWGETKTSDSHVEYSNNEKISISRNQIAQSFIARIKDFLSEKTKCALVLTSKILYNHKAEEFRRYWLGNFYINEVLELSPVREQLFSKAKSPAAVVFYQYACKKKTKDNIIIHTSVKPNIFLKYLKILVIEKNDIKKIKQEYFQKYDWLWKIMLYGNVFDFYFIKRLKENFKTLNKIISENNLSYGQGIQIGGGDKNDATHLTGKLFLDTQKKYLKKFFINDNNLEEFNISVLHRPRKKEIFQAPYVLLKKGFDGKDFSFISAYSEKDYVFTHSVTAISGNNKNLLKNICGIFNSVFANYYLLIQGHSAGVERRQSDDEVDSFTIPIKINKKISEKVDEIQKTYQRLNRRYFNSQELKGDIEKAENQLNAIVLKSFEVSSFEERLIDYATEISIPLMDKNNKVPIKNATEIQLKNYAQVFLDHFGSRWNGNPDFFEIDIYSSSHIIGMNFKVVKEKRNKTIELVKNFEKTEELLDLMKLGEKKYTNEFYEQKNIRGFNKTSFYIVKSNQYKNWHPAVAQADLYEFIEAMMKSGMKKFKNN